MNRELHASKGANPDSAHEAQVTHSHPVAVLEDPATVGQLARERMLHERQELAECGGIQCEQLEWRDGRRVHFPRRAGVNDVLGAEMLAHA